MTSRIIRRIDFDPSFDPVEAPVFSPVIEHELLTGMERAAEIVDRARQEAARLRKRGRDLVGQAVLEREEERKRGWDEGLQQGLAQVTAKIVEAERAHEKILDAAEGGIVRMVMEIAEKVIGREVKKGAVVDVVKKAIGQSVGQKIAVKIHPLDLEAVKKNQKEIFEAIDQTRTLTVKEDESVSRGGCVVETELGTIDARLETQLAAIRKALAL